jgi:hypothetical protein
MIFELQESQAQGYLKNLDSFAINIFQKTPNFRSLEPLALGSYYKQFFLVPESNDTIKCLHADEKSFKINIEHQGKVIFAYEQRSPYGIGIDAQDISAYKFTIANSEYFLFEYRNTQVVGTAINYVSFIVINVHEGFSRIYSTYNGSICNFGDFNGDKKLDFLDYDDSPYHAFPPFEILGTEVYFPRFIDVLSGEMIQSWLDNICLLDCNRSFSTIIILPKSNLKALKSDPCSCFDKKE